MARNLHGILLLDKPLGMSSAAAVAHAKRLFDAGKAGHTGSLDPLATGMLPICFGEATKFGSQMLDADKSYRVVVRFGERTASADRESPVIETRALPAFTEEDMRRALQAFPRAYSQVPPMHSALKQQGRPLYEYARAGIVRERAAREIVIRELTLLDWSLPELRFEVRCSKGAYIRVLAEDLAAQLGTVGHLVTLHRLGVAPFLAETPWTFAALEPLQRIELDAVLLPVDAALCGWRRLDLSTDAVGPLRQGRTVAIADQMPGSVRMYAAGLGFLGLGDVQPGGRLVPLRLIAA